MTRIVNSGSRRYRSSLREEQARATRDRILEAALRVMAGGIADASIPAIAHEAGVSVPTVYRHFATKADLFREIYPYSVRRVGLSELIRPTSLDDLGPSIRSLFDRIEAFDDVTRAAMASPAGAEVRALSMERRITASRQLAETLAPGLPAEDRERLARLVAILSASAALTMLRDGLSGSVDAAVQDIEWILRTVIAGATRDAGTRRERDEPA